jgi:hypothetical protein
MRKKKEDSLVFRIKDLRREIRKKMEEELLPVYKEFQQQGKYPWQGLWLKPQGIEKLQKKLKRRDKVVFVEVVFLFLLGAFISFVFYRIMINFLPN